MKFCANLRICCDKLLKMEDIGKEINMECSRFCNKKNVSFTEIHSKFNDGEGTAGRGRLCD